MQAMRGRSWPDANGRLAVFCCVLALVLSSGCASSSGNGSAGGSGGSPELVVSDIAAQTVVRNTLTPRPVDVSVVVGVADETMAAPDAFNVSLTSDDASVVAEQTFACTENPCAISFTPSPDKSEDVTVALGVETASATGSTEFTVSVAALLVRDRMDGDPAPVDSLRDLVGEAEEGDVIAFDTEGAFSQPRTVTLERPIQLQKDVTIEGHGVDDIALSGTMTTGLFVVGNSSRVVLRDMTLEESMQTEPGGAVNVEASSELTVERCTLTENMGVKGVAIHAIDATVVLDRAMIAGNATGSDPGVGAVVFAQGGTLRVLNGTTFADNIGGALAVVDGALIVEDSLFERNERVIEARGGAILVFGESESASAAIERSTFTENAAGGAGSAIAFLHGILSISESTFRGNVAVGDGCLYAEGASVTVDGSMFDANSARSGAAIRSTSTDLEVTGSTFQNNVIPTNERSGAINVGRGANPQPFVMRNSRVIGTIGFGAAVEVGRVVATIEDVEISGTRTMFGGNNGGGLFFNPEEGSVVRRTRIVDNRIQDAGGRGGGILASRSFLIEDCEISDNFAQTGGGIQAFFNSGVTLVVRNTVISGNEASVFGGGLYVGSDAEIELEMGTRVVGNEADEGGGAYVDEGGVLFVKNSTIGDRGEGNTADDGGGIYIRGGLELQQGATIRDNSARRGGGIAVSSPMALSADADLNSALIEENLATELGGGLWVNGGRVSANSDVLITANRVNEENGGGGMYVESGDVCDVPRDRVTGNWWGLLENNIEPLILCSTPLP